jgi:hypothetical protein
MIKSIENLANGENKILRLVRERDRLSGATCIHATDCERSVVHVVLEKSEHQLKQVSNVVQELLSDNQVDWPRTLKKTN